MTHGTWSQVDAAARQRMSDVRRARSLAIAPGWETTIFGFNADTAPLPQCPAQKCIAAK